MFLSSLTSKAPCTPALVSFFTSTPVSAVVVESRLVAVDAGSAACWGGEAVDIISLCELCDPGEEPNKPKVPSPNCIWRACFERGQNVLRAVEPLPNQTVSGLTRAAVELLRPTSHNRQIPSPGTWYTLQCRHSIYVCPRPGHCVRSLYHAGKESGIIARPWRWLLIRLANLLDFVRTCRALVLLCTTIRVAICIDTEL